jgi:uncharacterized protein with PIN domain
MVICLARWIRAAGYEAYTPPPGTSDQTIVEFILRNNLYLLTRDRALSQRRDLRGSCLLLTSNEMKSWVEELNHHHLIDWRFKPMSRCFVCNGTIALISASEAIPTPNWVHARFSEVFSCEGCHRIYWKGTHYWKILHQLERWSNCHRTDGVMLSSESTSG